MEYNNYVLSQDCSTPDSKADTLATHHSGSHPSLGMDTYVS